jgi:hypothetical protein
MFLSICINPEFFFIPPTYLRAKYLNPEIIIRRAIIRKIP